MEGNGILDQELQLMILGFQGAVVQGTAIEFKWYDRPDTALVRYRKIEACAEVAVTMYPFAA